MLNGKEGRLLRRNNDKDTNMKINILLCDDDKDFLQRISDTVVSQPVPPGASICITKSSNPAEITDRQLSQYHIMFLDIDMDERSGMDIARRVRELHLDTVIVFVTNYPEFSMEGYEVRAFRYLLKQELEQKLPNYFRDALAELPRDDKVLRFSANAESFNIPYKDILYLESNQRVIYLYTVKPMQVPDRFYGKMEDLAAELEGDGFLRIQKSYLVNMAYIKKFNYDRVDAFSARKMERFRHWIIVTSLAFLEATFLNIASNVLPAYSKILIALVLYYFVHRILYISNRFFGLYISIIIYATMCCIDNLWHTLALLLSETLNGVFLGNALCQSMLVHGVIIAVCFLQAKARNGKLSQATNFRWYTIPAVLSLASVLLIFFFGSCFQQGQISIQPLCVCATFITVMQIAALLLISWMEQNANFREEAISLQAKSKAQQESIEALSAAYAQQRKLTHDFRAHLSTLDGMLMQQNRDINKIQTYIHSLQSKQNERILLVNTHHAALDALLNQKALVAKNRKIDIQFSVNDLSPIKIDMVDLTVVISNTLDNAIEACEKLPETDRQIYVQALLEEDELFYAIRNKSLPVNMIANQLPASTKENPSFHGYGLQNVHTTLEKYHTLYAMDYENGWFEFATELPNTLIS